MDSLQQMPVPKLTDSRKKRPVWAQTAHGTLLHALGPQALRRWEIADLYWLRNLTAREVAEILGLKIKAVRRVLERLNAPRLWDIPA